MFGSNIIAPPVNNWLDVLSPTHATVLPLRGVLNQLYRLGLELDELASSIASSNAVATANVVGYLTLSGVNKSVALLTASSGVNPKSSCLVSNAVDTANVVGYLTLSGVNKSVALLATASLFSF